MFRNSGKSGNDNNQYRYLSESTKSDKVEILDKEIFVPAAYTSKSPPAGGGLLAFRKSRPLSILPHWGSQRGRQRPGSILACSANNIPSTSFYD
jgi:hypothetical protein